MIRSYITEHFRKKLKDHPTLVMYDPEGRYRELLSGMADDHIKVFDLAEDVLSVREEAINYYQFRSL